jgi:hypothetical protein
MSAASDVPWDAEVKPIRGPCGTKARFTLQDRSPAPGAWPAGPRPVAFGIGACTLGIGALLFGLRTLLFSLRTLTRDPRLAFGGVGALLVLDEADERLSVGVIDRQRVLSFAQLEADLRQRAFEAEHREDFDEPVIGAEPAPQRTPGPFEGLPVGVVLVVFLDAEVLVEGELAGQFAGSIAGREDFENNLRRDASLLPLLVGAPVSLRSAEDDHRIGGHAGDVVSLDRIPEEVAGHEDVGIILEEGVEPPP